MAHTAPTDANATERDAMAHTAPTDANATERGFDPRAAWPLPSCPLALTLEQRGFQLGFGPAPPLPLQKLCWLCEDGPCDTGTWFRLYGDGMMFCKACVCMSCFAPSPGSDPAQSAWEDQIAYRCKVKAVENFDLAAVSQEFLQQPGERSQNLQWQ
jgi:hypothetical protein